MLKDSRRVLVDNNKVEYLADDVGEQKKGYYLLDNHKYTRVTKLASIFDDLRFFYGKWGTKVAQEIGKEAAEKGTDIHELLHHWFFTPNEAYLGDITGWGNKINELEAFFSKKKMGPYCGEVRLFCKDKEFAFSGQFDGLWVNKQRTRFLLIDWKSGGFYPKEILQMAAYHHMLHAILKKEFGDNIKIDAVDIHTGRDVEDEIDTSHKYTHVELIETYKIFRLVCGLKQWEKGYKKVYKCFTKGEK